MVLPQFFLDIGQVGSQFSHFQQLKSDIRKVVCAEDSARRNSGFNLAAAYN